MANGDKLYFNGINGVTGQYALPPMTPEELSGWFLKGAVMPENLRELRWRYHQTQGGFLGVKEGVDATKLGEAGWGVLFAARDQERVPAIMEALQELLDLRREQAGPRYYTYTGEDALQPDESKTSWLARHGVGPGPADPDKVPYYLLLVGDPEAIPYRFQYQLDVQYAVGRIHFDTLEEYGQYARSVVMAERGKVTLPQRATFFNVHNLDDPSTALSDQHLVTPLAKELVAAQPDWMVETVVPSEAKRSRLRALLGGDETPALLFTASHGMYFPPDDPKKRQLSYQGAILCGEWRATQGSSQEIPREHYLAAEDVGDNARLLGLIAFHFACFSAGTPRLDDFSHAVPSQRTAIAPHAFVARLPRRLLGHPAGGALAVIGHIERGFPCSFLWGPAGAQLATFEGTLQKIMNGEPVGLALEYFNERYSELSTVLSAELEDVEFGKKPDLSELTGMWMANNDARNFVIVGDPAVRLPLAKNGAGRGRPVIAAVQISGLADTPPGLALPAAEQRPVLSGGHSVFREVTYMSSFASWPAVPGEADKEKHPELYAAWVEHTRAGYRNSDSVFSRILNAFMRSHYSTLVMYWILFAVGVGFFVTAVVLALQEGEPLTSLAFGVLSIVSFLTYFITRPSQTVEENLMYITWLGALYNTYWRHLNWSYDPQTAQAELDRATEDTIAQIKDLIANHAEAVARRPGLLGGRSGQKQGAVAQNVDKSDAIAGDAGEQDKQLSDSSRAAAKSVEP